MEPGELGESIQEKEPVWFLERLTRKEGGSWTGIRRRGRLGVCVLVRAPAVPVPKDLPGAGEYAPLREWGSHGLFGLRFMKGPPVCSRVSSETEK